MATAASNALWDDEGTRAICARQIELARDAGALEQLPLYLVALGTSVARGGDFAAAESLIGEIDEVTEATGTRIAPYASLHVLALRGRDAEASALIDRTVEEAASSGQEIAATVAHWVAAILHNGLGRYEQALEAARQASSAPGDLFAAMWALPELVEAAVRCGEPGSARDALERLVETTRPAGTDFGLGIEARSRALVSEAEVADGLYREAIERLGRTRLRPELARAHLLYGEWLRREGRRMDAREQLRTARGMLTAIGMEAFAERARRELLATGERVRKRTVQTRDDLTPQEEHIARLARDGLSNPEIGARLFLSPRTVEWHLKKVFTKLGITSRMSLHEALPSADPEATPA
jgi:ATP/maltotriose-dependent transcriptional regulator MalT